MNKIKAFIFIIILTLSLVLLTNNCSYSVTPKKGSIVIYGDTRTNHTIHRKIVSQIEKIEPKAVFNTGDLVADGNNPDYWDIFNSITANLRANYPYYPAIGNHERDSYLFYLNFSNIPFAGDHKAWYEVKIDSISFIILDSNKDLSTSSEQYQWFINALSSSDSSSFIVVIFHHPIFDVGAHSPDEKGIGDYLLPVFKTYRVSAVFNGHDHNYQRFYYNGTYHIITGGGGAPLYGKSRTSPYNQKFIKDHNFCTLNVINGKLEIEAFNDILARLDLIDIDPIH